MIKDLTTKDKQLVVSQLLRSLYEKTEEFYRDAIYNIAIRNQEAKKSPLLTFRFAGQTYKFENGVVRFPQTLAGFLQDEMNTIVTARRALDVEAAQIQAALVAASSRCESVTHLYQLLPELLHPRMEAMGIQRELDTDNFVPLTDDQVAEFKLKHKDNLDILFQRVTKNVLGVIQ